MEDLKREISKEFESYWSNEDKIIKMIELINKYTLI
ncbi:hypothetical protein JOC62_002031 [Clostridium sardiniense]|nr:hypothetical protein [Clostridium sardiniense]